MTTAISTELKTKCAIVSVPTGWDKWETKKFPLTDREYKMLARAHDNEPSTKMFTIPKSDGGILYSWELRTLKGFEDYTPPSIYRAYKCDFWVSHPLSAMCDCQQRYGVTSWQFITTFVARYPGRYHNQATDEQRDTVLRMIMPHKN